MTCGIASGLGFCARMWVELVQRWGRVMQPQVAIVTGASSGIGEATATLFAARGWAVVLAARSAQNLDRVAARIREVQGLALAVPTDVTAAEDRVTLVERTVETFGRVDALINNAGVGIAGTIETLDLDDMAYVCALNVLAPVALTQAVVPVMRRQPRGNRGLRGVIVNVSSVIEALPVPYMSGYGATKAALGYFSDAAAIELAQDRIAVVKVIPGLTATGFDRNLLESGGGASLEQLLAKAALLKAVPPARVAEEIWRAVGTGRSRRAQSLRDRAMVLGGRLFPRTANRLLKAAAKRYILPSGESTTADVRRDLRDLGLTAGSVVGAVAAVAVGTWFWIRDARRSRSFP